MKQAIHPQFFNAQVICVCGNRFTVGSTQEVIHIELCNKCHPFYTGEQKFVDSASRIQKFQKKQEIGQKHLAVKKEKIEIQKAKSQGAMTLREMLLNAK